MRTTALTLAAAALAAGTFLLTGCEPAGTVTVTGSGTSHADTSDGLGVDCDPNGFGPLSGCDSSPATQEQSPQTTEDKPAPGRDDSADESAEAEPAPCPDDSHNLDLGAGRFDDKNSGDCDDNSDAEHSDQSWDQKITEGRYDITVTWIVVSIKFTGFRECVLDLREAAAKSEDHFSRRVTTTEDCKAQQVHTVYRPVVSTGK